MKCTTLGCQRPASPYRTQCDRCAMRYEKSRYPLQQGRDDIKRFRYSKGDFRRASSQPRDDEPRERSRSRSKEKYSYTSDEDRTWRKRVESPERESPQKMEVLDAPSLLSFLSKPSKPTSVSLPLLFVPFEGNFSARMMGGYRSTGNQSASIHESGKSGFHIEQGERQFDEGSMQETFGNSSFWSKKAGSLQKLELLASSKAALQKMTQDEKLSAQGFYELVVTDRLQRLLLSRLSAPEQGLPEVIVLSERLLEWPDKLVVLGHRYRRHHVLSGTNLQDMAAFVLESKGLHFLFEVRERSGTQGKESFKETWLLVRKKDVYPNLTVACVHLSSKYTKVKTDSLAPILEQMLTFAKHHVIHAIVGDFNLNMYGIHGGAFPVSSEFVMTDKKLGTKTTFASSSGSGTSVYMGGMICDPRVSFQPTLTTFGSIALPPWFSDGKFKDKVFSDHHSLYGRYIFYDQVSKRWPRPPSGEGGGDCFFYALRRRLGKNETVDALRERIIDLISPTVSHTHNMGGGRSILVQKPQSDAALPLWCETPQAYMAEMRQPGRWVDDSILPFIAGALTRRILIQYDTHYAVFEADGSRHDEPGEALPQDGDIFMYCQGNHFW